MSLARFRPTLSQALAHGAYLGLLGALVAVLVAVPVVGVAALLGASVDWRWPLVSALALPGGLLLGALVGLLLGRSVGVDVDNLGLHRVPPGGRRSPPPFTPWQRISDIRAERRGARTVVAVYLDTGVAQRLAAPYDGRMLARDPQFEWKLFTLRNLWETHR